MHEVVEKAHPFLPESKDRLNHAIQRLIDLYTKCVVRGDRQLATQQLKLHQRENIAWERDTVWRQMIAQQRKGEVEDEPMTMGALLRRPGPGLFFIPTPLGTIRVTRKMIFKIIAGIIFVTLLNVQIVKTPEANRCFAILILCTILWATEVGLLFYQLVWCLSLINVLQAIPLFVTSMLVPLLLICFRVIRDDKDKQLSAPDATKYVTHDAYSNIY